MISQTVRMTSSPHLAGLDMTLYDFYHGLVRNVCVKMFVYQGGMISQLAISV